MKFTVYLPNKEKLAVFADGSWLSFNNVTVEVEGAKDERKI